MDLLSLGTSEQNNDVRNKRGFNGSQDGPPMERRRLILEQEFPADDEVEWRPISFNDSVQRRDFSQTKCWACLYGHLVEDKEKHPAHYGLFQILSQYYGKIDNRELWQNMKQYHEYYIRKPAIDDGGECMEWPVDVIEEHVLKHMNDPAIEFGEQIKDHKHIKDMLKNKISIRNENGELKHDLKVIEKFLQVSKSIRELHNCKLEKCLFYDRNLKIGGHE